MIIRFEFGTGEIEDLDNEVEDHAIFQSPFLKSVIECEENAQEAQINVPLPAFIQHGSMVEFLNFLYNNAAGDFTMDFGKYSHLTYRYVYNYHREYYYWGQAQTNPVGGLKAFLDWAEFFRGGCKPKSPETLLPIGKYFQMDMCASCGVLGESEDELRPCRRTGWPRVPVVPDWETVTKNAENKRTAWREAWGQADKERKESGKVVCCNDDLFCKDCIQRKGCQVCKEYECGDCENDKETPNIFKQWHERLPNADYEDEYGRRGDCPYRAMGVSRCLHCGKRICLDCGNECQECHRKACGSCQEDLNTWCAGCRGIIENNDDGAIGPIDRDEYVCRPCFDRRPHFCGCGEPSYDPEAEESGPEDEDQSDESHEEPEQEYYHEEDYYDSFYYDSEPPY